MKPEIRKALENIAFSLPLNVKPLVRRLVHGSVLLSKGINHFKGKDGERVPIIPGKKYAYEERSDLMHTKNLIEAYKAGGPDAVNAYVDKQKALSVELIRKEEEKKAAYDKMQIEMSEKLKSHEKDNTGLEEPKQTSNDL